MTLTEFKAHTQKSLNSLPSTVKDTHRSLEQRKLDALIHLNTIMHPHLKHDMRMHLDIFQMQDGPEKLRLVMLWDMALSQSSPSTMRKIINLMDKYLEDVVE
jgi:hypothetical protein